MRYPTIDSAIQAGILAFNDTSDAGARGAALRRGSKV
jgi:hypothetical protein